MALAICSPNQTAASTISVLFSKQYIKRTTYMNRQIGAMFIGFVALIASMLFAHEESADTNRILVNTGFCEWSYPQSPKTVVEEYCALDAMGTILAYPPEAFGDIQAIYTDWDKRNKTEQKHLFFYRELELKIPKLTVINSYSIGEFYADKNDTNLRCVDVSFEILGHITNSDSLTPVINYNGSSTFKNIVRIEKRTIRLKKIDGVWKILGGEPFLFVNIRKLDILTCFRFKIEPNGIEVIANELFSYATKSDSLQEKVNSKLAYKIQRYDMGVPGLGTSSESLSVAFPCDAQRTLTAYVANELRTRILSSLPEAAIAAVATTAYFAEEYGKGTKACDISKSLYDSLRNSPISYIVLESTEFSSSLIRI
jgi:hypothetical protein